MKIYDFALGATQDRLNVLDDKLLSLKIDDKRMSMRLSEIQNITFETIEETRVLILTCEKLAIKKESSNIYDFPFQATEDRIKFLEKQVSGLNDEKRNITKILLETRHILEETNKEIDLLNMAYDNMSRDNTNVGGV